MFFIIFLLFFINTNYFLYGMEENNQNSIISLMVFDKDNYKSLTQQFLIEHFNRNEEWSLNIAPNLFSNNLPERSKAQKKCSNLLATINKSLENINEEKEKNSKKHCCNIIIPFFVLGSFIFFKMYGPLETVSTATVTCRCAENIYSLEKNSQQLKHYKRQLLFIQKTISNKIKKSEENFNQNIIEPSKEKTLQNKKND